MSLIKLYKKHINEKADGSEIHKFFTMFNIGIEVKNPVPELESIRREMVATRRAEAEKWIYKNSKL